MKNGKHVPLEKIYIKSKNWDLVAMSGELTALIGRNIIIHGEYSPAKLYELVLSYLKKAYFEGVNACPPTTGTNT